MILFSIDTLSADHMSVFGHSRKTTPFLSRFARESLTLENLYSQGAYSLPSHYSLFTGAYAETHRIIEVQPNGNILDPSFKTLTECLKEWGYKTIWAGTPSHPQLDLSRGLGRGFDEIHEMDWATWKENLDDLKGILKKNKDKKFFIFLHTNMVHDPYHPVPPYDRRFDPGFRRDVVVSMDQLMPLVPPLPGESAYLHAHGSLSDRDRAPRRTSFSTSQMILTSARMSPPNTRTSCTRWEARSRPLFFAGDPPRTEPVPRSCHLTAYDSGFLAMTPLT